MSIADTPGSGSDSDSGWLSLTLALVLALVFRGSFSQPIEVRTGILLFTPGRREVATSVRRR